MNTKDELTLYSTPITPKVAKALIENPQATPQDLQALQAMIGNTPGLGVAHPLYRAALDRETAIVMAQYEKSK